MGVPAIVSASAGVVEHSPAPLAAMLLEDPADVRELRDRLLAWRGRMAEVLSLVRPLGAALRARSWTGMAEEMVALAARVPEEAGEGSRAVSVSQQKGTR